MRSRDSLQRDRLLIRNTKVKKQAVISHSASLLSFKTPMSLSKLKKPYFKKSKALIL